MKLDSAHYLRQQQQKKARAKIEARAYRLIDNFITPEKLEEQGDSEVFKEVDKKLAQAFPTPNQYRLARRALLKWAINYNKSHHKPIIEPMIPVLAERDKLMTDYDWFVHGGEVSQSSEIMLKKWLTKRKFNIDDYVQGFLYCTIVYGGLNDTEALKALYQWLLSDRKLYYTKVPTKNMGDGNDESSQYRIIIPLAIQSEVYGCRTPKDKQFLTRYVTYLPDDLSVCFLYALKDKDLSKRKIVNFETHIHQLSRFLELTHKKVEQPGLSHLIRFANFHWQQLEGSQISPAMVFVMMGRHRTTSLPTDKLLSYNQENLKSDVDVSFTIHSLFRANAPKQNTEQANSLQYPEFSRNLIRELQDALKLSRNKATDTVKDISQQYPQDNAQRLIGWVLSMLAQHQQLINNQSISQYIGVIGRQWLTLTMHETLSIWSAADYEEVYEEIIFSKLDDGRQIKMIAKPDDNEDFEVNLLPEDFDMLEEDDEPDEASDDDNETEQSKLRDNQGYTSGRIKAFHDYQRKAFSAPPIEFNWIKNKYVVKANIISPRIYHAMLHLLNQANLTQEEREISLSVIILAYRLGLRINELAGLQVGDFDGVISTWLWLRANRYRRLKSSSARRKFPIQSILKPNEFAIIKQFLSRKRRLKHTYLFSIGDGNQPLPLPFFANLAKLLWDCLLEKHDFSFHSFRHTAISQIAMVLNCEPERVALITDYNNEECQIIKTSLLGANQGQSHWFGLSSFAGHIDPDMTFKHYIHTAHLTAGLQQHQVKIRIPLLLLEKLTNLDYQNIYHINKDSYDKVSKNIELPLLRQYFSRTICQPEALVLPSLSQALSYEWVSQQAAPLSESQTTHTEYEAFQPVLLHYQFDDVIAFLQELQVLSLEQRLIQRDTVALRHNLSQTVAKSIIANIENFKFFKDDQLIFSQPRGQVSQLQVVDFLKNAQTMALEQPEKLQRFIEIFTNKVDFNTSNIRFGNKPSELNKMKDFVAFGTELLPSKNWQLRASSKKQANKIVKELNLSDEILTEQQSSYHGYQINIVAKTEKHSEKNPINRAQYYKSYGVLKFCGYLLASLIISQKKS